MRRKRQTKNQEKDFRHRRRGGQKEIEEDSSSSKGSSPSFSSAMKQPLLHKTEDIDKRSGRKKVTRDSSARRMLRQTTGKLDEEFKHKGNRNDYTSRASVYQSQRRFRAKTTRTRDANKDPADPADVHVFRV